MFGTHFYQSLSYSWNLGILQDVAQLVQGLLLHSVEGHEERDVGARLDAPPFELAPVGGGVISEVLGLEHQLLHHAEHQAGGDEVDNVGNKEADQVDGELDQEKGGDLEDLHPSNHDRLQLCNTARAKSFLPPTVAKTFKTSFTLFLALKEARNKTTSDEFIQ